VWGRAIHMALASTVIGFVVVIWFGLQPAWADVSFSFVPTGQGIPNLPSDLTCSSPPQIIESTPLGFLLEGIESNGQGPLCFFGATEGLYTFGFEANHSAGPTSGSVSFPIPDGSIAFAFAGNSDVPSSTISLSSLPGASCSNTPPGGLTCTGSFDDQTMVGTFGTQPPLNISAGTGDFSPGPPTVGLITLTINGTVLQELVIGPPTLPTIPEPSSALLILTGIVPLAIRTAIRQRR
jgi:hypothetical protein